MAFLFYILSLLLGIWPFKYLKQSAVGSEARFRTRRTEGRYVEYAIWVPFLGWGSAWAVDCGSGHIPRRRWVRVYFESWGQSQDTWRKPGSVHAREEEFTQVDRRND